MTNDSNLRPILSAFPTLRELGEREFIRSIVEVEATGAALPPAVLVGIGDDATVVQPDPASPALVVTVDAMVEDTHFRRAMPGEDVGYRLAVANLSDLAAMGAEPWMGVLAFGAPADLPVHWAKGFFRGLAEAGRQYGSLLLGGDTVRSPQIVASLTLIGRLAAGITPPQRSHARPGDRLFVTGNPGESGAGLRLELEPALKQRLEPAFAQHLRTRHFRPTPRLREGHALVRSLPRLALIDVSDGVFNEAGLLAQASGPGVGAIIRWDSLPQSLALQQAAPLVGLAPQHLTLFGGEDFELLFACDATLSEVQAIFRAEGSDTLVSEIGMMTAETGLSVVDALGATIELDPEIYAHFG